MLTFITGSYDTDENRDYTRRRRIDDDNTRRRRTDDDDTVLDNASVTSQDQGNIPEELMLTPR